MKLTEEAVMHIHAGIEVSMALVVACRAKEELAAFACDPLVCLRREPHAFGSTPRAILRGAMGIDFDTDHADGIGFFFRELVDFTFQLVGLFAIELPRCTALLGLDHSQPFKHEHTARRLLTHLDNSSGRLVSGIQVLPTDMCPQLLIAALSFDGVTCLPLLLRHSFEMPKSMLIQAMIRNKAGCFDLPMLTYGNHRKLLHIDL